MNKTIDGVSFKNMMDYGVRNLIINCDTLNGLNVFPVPDGDTGTNMVLTLQGGFRALCEEETNLSVLAKKFGSAIIFGARGNSGVIASQFFRGMADRFSAVSEANVILLAEALENGVKSAYEAVAEPVEGTILTVVREATQAVKEKIWEIETVEALIDVFLQQARKTLENTPNLLPVLKDAGVIDSGGAGIVYFFEGIQKYFNGEKLQAEPMKLQGNTPMIDVSAIQMDGEFYGYCTEFLIQLMPDKKPLDFTLFKKDLSEMGDSLVTYCDEEKLRVHIHSFSPGEVMQYCQQYGEFLTIKIENMAVQHTEAVAKAEAGTEFLVSQKTNESSFAIIAVATDKKMGKTFLEMGADVVIVSTKNVSSEDFICAAEKVKAPDILLFPNNSNSFLAAKQASKLYETAKLTVIRCGDIPKCYASLAILDFGETDIDLLVDAITETIDNLYTVAISRSVKTMTYGAISIEKGDYISMSGDDILVAEKNLETTVLETVRQVMEQEERSVITLFYNPDVSPEQLDSLTKKIQEPYLFLEVYTVPTEEKIYDLSISFE